jgi:GcrA cell cycle regulator
MSNSFQASAVDLRDPVAAKKKMLTTIDLTVDTCRWPFGDPATPNFHYCGDLPLVGVPYCQVHNSKAYHPMRSKTTAIPGLKKAD